MRFGICNFFTADDRDFQKQFSSPMREAEIKARKWLCQKRISQMNWIRSDRRKMVKFC
jgi:hypothetical protein